MEENRTEVNQIEESRMTYDMGGLKTVFWGLLFTAVNIRIMGFDIVPDFIGYIIVIMGLKKIEAYEGRFTSAKRMAQVLTAVSLINIYQAPAWEAWGTEATGLMENATGPVNFSAGIFGDVPWLALFLMIVGLLANLFFIYSMCMGMKSLLLRIGDFALAGICDDRWKLFLAAEIGLMVSVLLVYLGAGTVGGIFGLIFGVLALIALILFLVLIHRVYKSLGEKEVI
ncbi:MAG TPA: hypothetical protein VN381_02750 [Anaerovoracaceae bacterium]|nr:hypothetical protein [Anaerovoracaceae bacterium]